MFGSGKGAGVEVGSAGARPGKGWAQSSAGQSRAAAPGRPRGNGDGQWKKQFGSEEDFKHFPLISPCNPGRGAVENQRGRNSPRDTEFQATGTALDTEPLTPGQPPAATRAIAGRSGRCAPRPRSGAMNGPHSQPAVFIDPSARPRAARTTSPLCACTRCAHTRQRVRTAPGGGREGAPGNTGRDAGRGTAQSGPWAHRERIGRRPTKALLGCPGPTPHPARSSSACSPNHRAAKRHGQVAAAAASSKSPPLGWGHWDNQPHCAPVP